jgi:hypothetical protein
MVFEVDENISDEVIEEITNIENIKSAKAINI